MGAHGAVASAELGEAVTAAVLADYRRAPIAEPLRAMLAYLERVTLAPGELGPADVQALKAAGVTKAAAHDALLVAYCFNQINRVADVLGWEVVSPGAFAKTAKQLLRFGYLLPFHRGD